MSTPTKTVQSDLFAMGSILAGEYKPAPGTSPFGITSKMGVGFTIYFAPVGTGASPPATRWGFEKKVNSAGADQYAEIMAFFSPNSQAIAVAVSSGGTTGQNKCILASISNVAIDQILFFKNTTFNNSEWKKVVAIDTGTGEVTFSENFESTQTTSTAYIGCDIAYIELDLTVMSQGIRFFVNNNRGPLLSLTNRDVVMRCAMETLDSFG